jgi:hypothetical protein
MFTAIYPRSVRFWPRLDRDPVDAIVVAGDVVGGPLPRGEPPLGARTHSIDAGVTHSAAGRSRLPSTAFWMLVVDGVPVPRETQ